MSFETHPTGTVAELMDIVRELREQVKKLRLEKKLQRTGVIKRAFIAGYEADGTRGPEDSYNLWIQEQRRRLHIDE